MATGAQIIVSELERAGVCGLLRAPGVHNLALWAALRESSIRLIGVRHEQAAAYAADGYARATGKLGVALTTTGPGAANTLGAVGEAWASRSPILVIATDIPSTLRRRGEYRGILHETDGQSAMFAPVVKSVAPRADAGLRGPGGRATAVRDATTAPTRPVYLEIATDLLAAEVPRSATSSRPPVIEPHAGPRRGRQRAARRAPSARCSGSAAARATPATAVRVARRAARRARADHLRRGGHAPARPSRAWSGCRRTSRPPGRLWDEADVVIAIGSDLDGVQTQNFAQPQPETLIAIGLERPTNYRVDAFVEADASIVASLDGRATASVTPGPRRAPAPSACAGLDATALRFLDSIRFARPRRRRPRRRHVHPGLLARGLLHARRAAPPAGPARLGNARLRVPGRARRRARRHRPGRLDLRRRRLPVRLRRARDAWPRRRSR